MRGQTPQVLLLRDLWVRGRLEGRLLLVLALGRFRGEGRIRKCCCRLDRVELLLLCLSRLIGTGVAITQFLSRQVVSDIDGSLLLVLIVYIDSVHSSTSQVDNLGEIPLSIALLFLISMRSSIILQRLHGRVILLRLSGQVTIHLA